MKNKRKKKFRVLKAVIEVIKEMLSSLKYNIIKGLGKFAVILQIVFPTVLAVSGLNPLYMLLLSGICTVVLTAIKEIGRKLNNLTETDMPVPEERFTYSDANGYITINDDKVQLAMVYLYELEEYMTKKGWVK